MPPCPPRCPPNPVFPKVCCPPPCCPDPCIKPSRKCFIPPPCCPKPCCKKMALVVSSPICPPKCCPPLPCCEPQNCPDPCARGQSSCCGPCCPSPAMIVRPLRNNCCPPPPRIPNNQQCPIPCCNPLPPCCVIVKPCQPRCCPKPMVVSFKCPTSVSPMAPREDCPQQVSWPSPPKIDMCCSSNCPPKERDMCFMTVRPMPPSCCPPKGNCGGISGGNGSRQCCKPRWNGSPITKCASQSVDFSVPPLASLSQRYNCWVCSVPPATDSNLCPSRFSSRVENSACQMVAVMSPIESAGDCCV
ncbi:keratin-associated protein 10-3 isoform X3 [Folsomia candida]|uniref:keratin-associated protein 10-3 isoform X3 n=1 Tax=Folsomia candida TaxID=158441 RepID=UPI00160537B4|nr:keratin-associated protein 10-3 isoform X3 [Folsomia candida]